MIKSTSLTLKMKCLLRTLCGYNLSVATFIVYCFHYIISLSNLFNIPISKFWLHIMSNWNDRSSHPELFLGKGVLKICSKFTGEHPCRNAISIKLFSNFFEIGLWHGCFPINLLHIFRKSFPKNTSGLLLLDLIQ